MKKYKTAKTILRHAIDDIDAGLWCRGALAKYGKYKTQYGAFDLTSEESFSCAAEDSFEMNLLDKPTGCALGLVSMYAGLGTTETQVVNGKKVTLFVPRYPEFKDGEGVRAALIALAKATPKKYHHVDIDTANDDEVAKVIYSYNDDKTTTKGKASKWFNKALAQVSA